MGNTPSNLTTSDSDDIWWKDDENPDDANVTMDSTKETEDVPDDFISEFNRKREKRKLILEAKRIEIQNMREEISFLREENERLKKSSLGPNYSNKDEIDFFLKENQKLKLEITNMKLKDDQTNLLMEKNTELKISISEMQNELLQLNTCILDFEQEKQDYKRHVTALKDVIKVSKELLVIRENELKELKEKLKSIETAFQEKEASLMSNDLRKEYERQLGNIRTLRELYEERSRTYRREATLLKSSISEKEKQLEDSAKKMSEYEERINQLEKDNSERYDTIKSLESNLGLAKAERRQCQAELEVINQLFSHILLDFNNSPDIDLNKLLKQLQEHHDLLKNIVSNEISSEVSSILPKVLLDLINQISCNEQNAPTIIVGDCFDSEKSTAPAENESSTSLHNLNSPAEIVENLPKVWRVLIELLSHQSNHVSERDTEEEDDENRCFKTIATPGGPSLVLSVSKTFFRLKELIIEKKALEKDMSNLKQLNSHLETRLQDQEKRFEVVSHELSKTWNFVGKLQKEHHLLHTQEKILRYELAQKRKLLKELRVELEYSREKWQQAREKNSKTEKEWLTLRKEFASRKKQTANEDGNNSVESGFSDEREESSDEEPGYETDISECNMKIVDPCQRDIDIQEENQEITPKECTSSPEIEENISTNKNDSEKISDTTSNSKNLEEHVENNRSIINVIKGEIDVIAKELPCDLSLENGECSSSFQVVEQANTPECSSIENSENQPSSSNSKGNKTLEERLAARDERLKRLEGQCKALVSQVTNTSNRSVAICNKLEDLHEIYGETSRNTQENTRNENDPNVEEPENN